MQHRSARSGHLRASLCLGALCGLLTCALPLRAQPADEPTQSIRERGIEIARVAKSRARAKNFALAAQLFREAYRVDRAEWSYLFSAARCEQLGGDLKQAQQTYQRFLDIAPTDHALRGRATSELAQVQQALRAREPKASEGAAPPVAAPVEPKEEEFAEPAVVTPAMRQASVPPLGGVEPPPQPGSNPTAPGNEPARTPEGATRVRPPAAVTAAPASGLQRTLGWVGVGLGVAVGGAGGALFALASGDKRSLEREVNGSLDSGGKVTALTHETAQARKGEIEGRLQRWGIVAGVGAGLTAVGALLLATSPDQVQVEAGLCPGGGVRLAWTKRF